MHKRQMLLIEDGEARQVIEYILGYCLFKYDVELHAIIVKGNHTHRVDTDAEGIRPRFIQDFHSFFARQPNRYYQEGGAFLSEKQTNIMDNATANDALQRIAYTTGNPVADGIERDSQ